MSLPSNSVHPGPHCTMNGCKGIYGRPRPDAMSMLLFRSPRRLGILGGWDRLSSILRRPPRELNIPGKLVDSSNLLEALLRIVSQDLKGLDSLSSQQQHRKSPVEAAKV